MFLFYVADDDVLHGVVEDGDHLLDLHHGGAVRLVHEELGPLEILWKPGVTSQKPSALRRNSDFIAST